ncbi:MAG TPA: T9SS type A sorting domain-containing protein [Chitinophagales bacterium]|nr:T9SS type A sorting domain-containing protein [Chitinophagales bacterium]
MSKLYQRPANRTRALLRNRILIGAAAGFIAAASLAVIVVSQSGDERMRGEGPTTFTITYPSLTFKKVVATQDGKSVASDGTHFWKFDSAGQVIWSVNVLPPAPVLIQSLVETSDDGIVAVCQSSGSGAGSKIYVVKIKQDGAFAWARMLEKEQSEFAYGASATHDNGVVLCGSGCSTANYLLKLNDSGQQSWLRDFPVTGATAVAQKVMTLPDGGFVLAGRYQNGNNHALYLARTDAFGALQYARMYTVPAQIHVKALKAAPDGGYGIAGQFTSGTTNPFVMKVDGTGNAQWFKTIGAATTESLNDLAFASDNSMLCIGNVFVNENENVNMLLAKFDPTGQLLWHVSTGSETLNGAGYDDGLSIAAIKNGLFMLVGYSNGGTVAITDGGGNGFCHYANSSMAVESLPIQMQTLSLGSVIGASFVSTVLPLAQMAFNPQAPTLCYGNLNTGINEVHSSESGTAASGSNAIENPSNEGQLSVYPNPNNGSFTVAMQGQPAGSTLVVTDLSGKVVHSEKITDNVSTKALALGSLGNGTYLVYLKTDNAVIGTSRFVVQH